MPAFDARGTREAMTDVLAEPYVRVDSYLGEAGIATMADDVRNGLTRDLKELPPKYLYDARGSELFDRITEQPEYYPTRTERAIINRYAPQIAAASGAQELVELGSGSASKTRALLYAMAGAGALTRYVPVDVDETVVERCALELVELYPGLSVHGVVGDFERHLGQLPGGDRRLFAFLGGTIGNLYPEQRAAFLSRLRDQLEPDDRVLLGVDLVKDVHVLEAAYNDRAGVTAEFNRNVLRAINNELGACFEPAAFDHVAFFDSDSSWIEMRLRSRADQRVSIPGAGIEVDFGEGDEMRTEISTKFTRAGLERDLGAEDLAIERFYTDAEELFGLALAAPR